MGRAPCCEKMGLKKGPWSSEEDQILTSYVQKHGHPNWRALPKQAGLLRCGKSCRLRWVNYLSPDIKRGNFTPGEEEAIIELHQLMGNRWSAIAAKLPGRTDNEIKNIWHTHLKKKLSASRNSSNGTTNYYHHQQHVAEATAAASPQQSTSSTTSTITTSTSSGPNDEDDNDNLVVIDESFWSETCSFMEVEQAAGLDINSSSTDYNNFSQSGFDQFLTANHGFGRFLDNNTTTTTVSSSSLLGDGTHDEAAATTGNSDDDAHFWYNVFIAADCDNLSHF